MLGGRTGEATRGSGDGTLCRLSEVPGGDDDIGEVDVSLTGRLAWRRSRVLKFLA